MTAATSRPVLTFVLLWIATASADAILAGGEFDLPEDRPSWRIDPLGAESPFNFVGALSIQAGGFSYIVGKKGAMH